MRYLPILLLLAAPLLAQEDQSETLKKFLDSWAKKLDDGQKKLLESEMKKVSPAALEILIEVKPEMHIKGFGIPSGSMRLLLERMPSELITGTWKEKGKKGSYILKSLGEGLYELRGTIEDKDGKKSEFTETATLGALRGKHKFLRATIMIGTQRGVGAGTFQFRSIKPDLGDVGLLVHPASPELRHHLAIAQGAGQVVGMVVPGSRAEKLGLKKYDVLVKLGGALIDSPEQLKKLKENKGILEYIRRGKAHTLDLAKR